MRDILKPRELARLCGVSPDTVRGWCIRKQIKFASTPGGHKRFQKQDVLEFLKGWRRDVIIMADKDEAKERPDGSLWYPGQDGAARLSKVILPIVRSIRIVKPPFHKDIREWYKAGATREVVESVIRNTRYVA